MKKKLKKLLAVVMLLTVVLSANAFAFRPIFHPPTVSILDALRNDEENFSVLIGLIRKSGLDELAKEGKSFTLLAPTNAAFAKLPAGTLDSLTKDRNKIRELLFSHTFPGKVLFKAMFTPDAPANEGKLTTKSVKNLGGGLAYFQCNEHKAFAETVHLPLINGKARVLASDFEGRSAVIQVIDTVLLEGDNSANTMDFGASPATMDFGAIPRNETANGLNTTTFDTLVGTVAVNLPEDLAAGDTISGTVIAEGKKRQNKDQSPRDLDEISGYVVEVAEQGTPMKKPDGNLIDSCKDPAQDVNDKSINVCKKWSIPEGVAKIPVVLKNKEGKVVARAEVPVAPKGNVAGAQADYHTPAVGQAGKPVSVRGPFDGDFASTAIKLGNQTAKFLASSPRKVVVESPRDLKGVNDIEVEHKGKVVAKCAYRSISIRLAADKLNLVKGETTSLTVTLAGLIGLLSPVEIQLTNRSSGTVSLEGGETQTITVSPGNQQKNQTNSLGLYKYIEAENDKIIVKRTLTGVKAGGFSINAAIDPPSSGQIDCGGGGRMPGDRPVTPDPQPSPAVSPTPDSGLDSGGNPRGNNGPGNPVAPMRGRFRVTFNGFSVAHVTNHGFLQRPDAVTFHPIVGRVNADGSHPGTFLQGDTTTIGMVPENPVRGGASLPSGGFQSDDGFPTRRNPWVRTLPRSSAPLTIPPTQYFEGEIVQNTNAAYIIPTIWSVDGRRDMDLVGTYLRSIRSQLDPIGRAIGRMITREDRQPISLATYRVPVSAMGLANTMSLDLGVMQDRPIGMIQTHSRTATDRVYGFRPKVLVLTYESADFFSRTSFGFGTGIVPVQYQDGPDMQGDYTMYLHVERMDSCAEDIRGALFNGSAVLTTNNSDAPGPYPGAVENLRVNFTDCRRIIQITDFPPLVNPSNTRVGPNTSTMTMFSGGSGTFNASTGRIDIQITLGLVNTIRLFGNSTLPLRLTGTIDPTTGVAALSGTGRFDGGQLGTTSTDGTVVVTGSFSPRP